MWLVERKGRMSLAALSDYTLASYFGSREAFEREVYTQGYNIHRLIRDREDLEGLRRLNTSIELAPWTGHQPEIYFYGTL